jgi:type I restriction-modification system DNA methylase subunit/restriction endonuclease S subunit
MLSKETKKKIDDARDILVGQLPLPSDQVELITIALIYKFMDDQDEDLRQLGFGEAFFTEDLKEYSWQRLMSNEIDAEARVNSFIKGIEEIQKAAHIPLLFREIFKNTFLKFRDGRTLHLFLKVINGFSYDHSEELGNAFEYLLMSMGAQGENGQFRTPRNIIDFIVEVVDPDKGNTILDPACGTGGFLLSAYKHILRKQTTGMEHYRITLNNEDIEGIPVNWGDKLTPEDLQQLGTNIEGYDITPLMARLARVNLYLHQFKSPRIHEYDTLTSDGRWKDKYDCILANPPFMTPKGGVSTHSKFRIRATKAEVLFSDYILEHLTPDGMAGFIVPEGIIFQNSGDYVALRKWLVETTGLWAVVSLPAQVFQPYSGVKTSILFIDRNIARGREEIILLKVENDGYSLNTNRAPTTKNDLPEALNLLTMGKKSLSELREYLKQNSGKPNMPKVLIKPRKVFAKLDAYKAQTSAFNLIRKQHEKCQALEAELKANPPHPSLIKEGAKNSSPLTRGDRGGLDSKRVRLQTAFAKQTAEFFKVSGVKYERLKTPIQGYFDTNLKETVIAYGADSAHIGGLPARLCEHLEGEREYNLNFDKYTEVNSSETNVHHMMVTLGEICEINPRKAELSGRPDDTEVSFVPMQDMLANNINFTPKEKRKLGEVLKGAYTYFQDNDVLLAKVTPCFENGKAGRAANLVGGIGFGSSEYYVLRASKKVLPEFIYCFVTSQIFRDHATPKMTGTGGLQRVPKNVVSDFKIPLPPLEIQKQIVTEIEAYQKVIDGCNLIIENYNPGFDVDLDWPMVELGKVCEIKRGKFSHRPRNEPRFYGGDYPFIQTGDVVRAYNGKISYTQTLNEDGLAVSKLFSPPVVLVTIAANIGDTAVLDFPACFPDSVVGLIPNDRINPWFLELSMRHQKKYLNEIAPQSAQKNINIAILNTVTIPLPPLETQQKIVVELEQDLAAVAGAKRLKAKMEANIRAVIGRVWGEKR